ncbi:DeoR faimly transcriptional regulator [Pseudaestuariivita atlantica]|uniref:DeoR faimly transcriptional regulator n=2 Tax=Pseudaestuariivita atlantica TaxID=1317121 RepID=A0A0L1JPY4_9RHOB|nr:DeoR faimly transcriptional regulator [Pseudaestuariivita atlantica]
MGFRQADILELARAQGAVTVDDLAAQFGVTAQTIRRDLTELAEAGQLERVHGGAVLPSGVANIEYEERRRLNDAAKAAIAAACAADIPDAASVFLNIGTTTEAVAKALMKHRGMMIFTNNLNVATLMAGAPEVEVMVTGGMLRHADGGLVGAAASRMIENFKFDIAVIGCSAIDPVDGDILDFDLSEVGVSQSILSRARKRVLVADHSKWQRAAPARIASLREIDVMFTDGPVPDGLAQRLRDWGTEVRVCD